MKEKAQDAYCKYNYLNHLFRYIDDNNKFKAGQAIGLKPNFHGDEIKFVDSGTLGAECNALAISHLENLDDNGIDAMAKKNVIGVILPTTHYLLKLKDPPVRKMIDSGGIILKCIIFKDKNNQ